MNLAQKIAHILAMLTHPVFVVIWLAFILFTSSFYMNELLPSSYVWRLSFPIIASVALVLLLSLIAWQTKIYAALQEKNSRHFLLGIYLIVFFLLFMNYRRISLPSFYVDYLFLSLLYALGGWILLFKWNYSFHVLGWAGMFFTLIFYHWFYDVDLIYWIIFSAIMTGFVASLRLFQNAHTEQEILRSILVSFSIFVLSICCKSLSFWP
jgi:hypothetical protein